MPLSGGKRFGKYELIAPIAAGGTAEIFLARLHGEGGFQKFIVVKRLLEHLQDDKEFVDMFLDEARLGSNLDHSNIVQTMDLGEMEGRYYIALEYLAGLSLAQVAELAGKRLRGGLPVEVVLFICAQSCNGLHYAHEKTLDDGTPLRIVHRDISPQNIIITFEGEVKIVDFGIAHAAVRDTRTKAGFIKGKFAYMSPEQCAGKVVDRRTDVFAMGIVAHELLTGRRLFKRASAFETYSAIVKHEVTVPSQVNPRLNKMIDAVILKALAHNPDERYPTCEAFSEALMRLLYERGQSMGTGQVARFIEETFAPELEAHGEKMGALVEGRATRVAPQRWDAAEGGEEADLEVSTDPGPSDAGEGDYDAPDEGSTDPEAAVLERVLPRRGQANVPDFEAGSTTVDSDDEPEGPTDPGPPVPPPKPAAASPFFFPGRAARPSREIPVVAPPVEPPRPAPPTIAEFGRAGPPGLGDPPTVSDPGLSRRVQEALHPPPPVAPAAPPRRANLVVGLIVVVGLAVGVGIVLAIRLL